MDEMQVIEIDIMTKYIDYAEVAQWTQTRQLMLSVLKPYLKNKKLTAQELWPLACDDEGAEHRTDISNEELEWYKRFKENYKKDRN